MPMRKVKEFNAFVASLCRAAFLPWCACCNAPISKDCAQATAFFPGKRYCRSCKLSVLFISDLELATTYGIKMKDHLCDAVKVKHVEKKLAAVVEEEENDDEDDAFKIIASKKTKRQKKTPTVRPPPARKPSSSKNRRGASHNNPFYRRDSNGDLAAVGTVAIRSLRLDMRRLTAADANGQAHGATAHCRLECLLHRALRHSASALLDYEQPHQPRGAIDEPTAQHAFLS